MAENNKDRLKQLAKDQELELKGLQSLEKEIMAMAKRRSEFERRARAEQAAGRSKAETFNRAMQQQLEQELELMDSILSSKKEQAKTNEATRAAQKKSIEEQIEGEKRAQEALKKKAEVFNDIAKTLKNIPGIGGLLSDVFTDAAKRIEETGSKAQGLLSVLDSIASVAGPAVIVKSLLDISNQTQTISRNLGVGFENAREIRKEFSQIAQDANDVRINSIDLVKAQGNLIQAFQLSVAASGEVSQNFIRNSEYLGASVDAAGKLERIIAITGNNSTEFSDSLAVAANEAGNLYGVNLPLAKVVEEISKFQGATLSYIMDSPAALAKAVAMSEKLGIEFSKIRSIADGLVNFENSITAELEAEVLLGRDINLNKARQLAFMGDEVGLAEEIGRQIGSVAEFNSMLPVQQRAFAQALGMSRDELADMVMQQELSARFGEQARDLTTEQLQAAKKLADSEGMSDGAALRRIQEQASATKRFEDAAQKIRAAFQDALVSFAPTLEKIADVVGTLAKDPLAKVIAVGAASIGLLSAGMKLIRNLTGIQKVFVVNSAGGGSGMLPGGPSARNRSLVKMFGGASQAKKVLGRVKTGGAIGLVGGLTGEVIRRNAESAVGAGFGAGLSGASSGAGLGLMVGGVPGAIIGGAIGGVAGYISGYMDKKESEREARRAEIQKEIDQRGAVADELKQIRELMANGETSVYMDGDRVGTVLNKGAALNLTAYQI